MLKDKILIGAIIGLLAGSIKLSVNFVLYLLNFTNVVFWQITATRFLEKGDLFQPAAYVIGGIADLTVTAVLGIIFFYAVSFIGREYLWLKGIGFGLLVWVSLFGTLLGQSVQNKLPQEPMGILVTLTAHFFFGLGLAFFTWLFYLIRNDSPKDAKKLIYRLAFTPAKKSIASEPEEGNEEDDDGKVVFKKPIKLKDLKRK